VEPALIWQLMREHGVTTVRRAHRLQPADQCARRAAWHAGPRRARADRRRAAAGRVIEGCEAAGIDITHVYGLTEVYGPAAVCAAGAWAELPADERAAQRPPGRRYPLQEAVTVLDPTPAAGAADGETMGEICFRGNVVMKGYLKNSLATEEAFAGGWFHTGDLAVVHPTATSRSRTAARTSSSPAARTSARSRWRTCCTATRP
jgi:fatty-acyl-CoA synthase